MTSSLNDFSIFPFTVPGGVWYVVVGVHSTDVAGGWSVSVANSAGTKVIEMGIGLFTDSTAYPYLYFITTSNYPVILQPGDVVSATNVSGLRLAQVNEPQVGEFII